MRSVVSVLAVVVAVLVLFVGGEIVLGEMKDVSGTKHDVAPPDVSPCVYCHLPRDSEGEVLWARDPNTSGPLSGLKSRCFSCHDGTVTSVGVYAFNTSRPMHLRSAGVKGEDCDRCHDPHGAGSSYGSFLRVPGGADFCWSCHSRAGPEDHPVDVDSRAAGIEPTDSDWDPDHGDFSGTRLWNREGTGPGDFVKCLTCHATHGGVPETEFNTMAFESTHESFLPLCLNCHYGWGSD